VITNLGTKTIALPSSLNGNGPSSDILTLWFTSDAVNDEYFKDTASGRTVKIEVVPASAELYARTDDPHSFLLVAPNQSVEVHASSRVQLQPGTHTATAHAELLHILVRNSSISSELVGTADSEAVTTTLSTANPRWRLVGPGLLPHSYFQQVKRERSSGALYRRKFRKPLISW
jgi:hypothetical protein